MREQRDSWLSLVMLCAVAVLSAALGLSVLFAGASVVFGVVQSPSVPSESPSEAVAQDSLSSNPFSGNSVTPDPQAQAVASEVQAFSGKEVDENGAASSQTFTGMVTDSHCGARHSMKSGKTSAECARSCVRQGARYVLVDGEETHGLEGDPIQLDGLAGVRVKVIGSLVGDTIKVKSVVAR